ncbi:MAG: YHS domain-containing protein [Dehalococcoidia bacterium]|nr:YHS domain-containing protein [Dehalococcoidia bacterium]
MAVDPVCKMEVDEKKSKFTTAYKGKTYYFCSKACKEKFDTTLESLKKAGSGICFGVRVDEVKEMEK